MEKMNSTEQIAHQFYQAFQALDADNMNSLYSSNARFSDPGFGLLNHTELTTMWAMLCFNQQNKGFKLEYKILDSTKDSVTVYWQAWYTFSKTGRKVHNRITANILVENGRIVQHHDHFNLHKWASQALGITGYLLGWTGFFQKKLQQQTKNLLKQFQEQQRTNSN
jgi:ketosteroid isomerase-like protein